MTVGWMETADSRSLTAGGFLDWSGTGMDGS